MQSAEPVKVVICISVKPNFTERNLIKVNIQATCLSRKKTKVTHLDRLLIYPNSIASDRSSRVQGNDYYTFFIFV